MKWLEIAILLGSFAAAGAHAGALANGSQIMEVDPGVAGVRMVSVSGAIDNTMAKKLKASLERSFHKPLRRTAILITSPGGIAQRTAEVGNVILDFAQRMGQVQDATTVVLFYQECSSACTFLLPFLTRWADPKNLEVLITSDTKLILHGPQEVVRKRVDGSWMYVAAPTQDPIRLEDGLSTIYSTYNNVGVNPDWLAAYKDIINHDVEDVALTAADLCASNSRMVNANACVAPNIMEEELSDVLATSNRVKPLPNATSSRSIFDFFFAR